MGTGRPQNHPDGATKSIQHHLYLVQRRRPGSLSGYNPRFQNLQSARNITAAGRQRFLPLSQEIPRKIRTYPPANRPGKGTYVDQLLTRPQALGRPQNLHKNKTRILGLQPRRTGVPACRNQSRLACLLPRRQNNRLRCHLPARPGTARPR